jgi:hypothetical protein
MAHVIQSPAEMVSYAGDLRRSARHLEPPELAAKVRQAADELEKSAFARLSLPGAGIGRLLDTIA